MALAVRLVPLLALAVWAYCVFDVIATDESRVQHLPKLPWLLIVLLFPVIGAVAWLVLGRPYGASFRPGGPPRPTWAPPQNLPRHRLPTEDLPPLESREEALRRYYEEKEKREREIRELEERLREANAPEPPIETSGDGSSDGPSPGRPDEPPPEEEPEGP